jgi:hypothetical protein
VCATASVGVIDGGGVDIATPRSGAAPYAATGARVGLDLPIAAKLFLRLQVDAAYVVDPVTIRVSGDDPFTVSPIVAALGAAGVVRF